ncbi:hypothetical protein CAEBREN_17487 [Caenorhabditis brenneri]|uniref:F-box domain-containing protein n=1 Tax=Caenorhabditis brenneri TaxID=135651 RepID=G0PLH0_CAEBE|nr:hypothetical protein CAEBREN_17487 [Caenorhabditis brenneri]
MFKNFLTLPLLVHLKIFSCLSPTEYSILSLCSRRTKILVKWRKRERLELKIHVETRNKFSFFALGADNTEHKLMVLERDFEPNCTSVLRLGDLVMKYQSYTDQSETVHIKYHYNLNPLENLAESFSDLFHTPGNITWKLETLDVSGVLKSIKKSIILRKNNCEELEKFYSSCPDQEFTMIEEGWNLWTLEHHKILQQKNLVLKKLRPNLLSFLVNFRGENAVFECVHFEDLHVKELLKQWILKRDDPLRSLIIKQQIRGASRVDYILEGVKHLELKKMVGNRFYSYESE